jgi:hypothetical protein
MAEGRRGGANSYRVISGGASDPLVLAGTADPSSGGGVSAPEGSIYMRYVSGAGKTYYKAAAADTAWTEIPSINSGPLAGVESNLWAPPASPHSEDDEFTSDTIDSGDWTTQGDTWDNSTPPQFGDSFSTGNLRYEINSAVRPSHLRMQAVGDGTQNFCFKRFSGYESELPDGTYWARLTGQIPKDDSFTYPNEGTIALCLGYSANGSSFNYSQDSVMLYPMSRSQSSGIYALSIHRVAGTPTSNQLNDLSGYIPHVYAAIIKDGNYCKTLVAPEGGRWVQLDSVYHGSPTYELNAVGIFVMNNVPSSSYGNAIVSADFFRYRSDGDLP